jgi:hypothetical protein
VKYGKTETIKGTYWSRLFTQKDTKSTSKPLHTKKIITISRNSNDINNVFFLGVISSEL